VIVVTGAAGQLGTAFGKQLPEARLVTRRDLDLAKPGAVGKFLDATRPDLLINCAAYTAVDAAESDEETAAMVNSAAVEAMAAWCGSNSARFVTFSTDYVFSGDVVGAYVESSVPDPRSAYGRTKLAGERAALAVNPESLVIRTSWVVSGTHPNFVATMLKRVATQELRVVDDQRGCPTVTDDLAAGTLAAIDAGATGILHLTNQGVTTWFELARHAVSLAGHDPLRVSPCSTDEYPRPAPRPANSELASERLDELGLGPLPHWRESLPAVVNALLAAS